MGGWTRKPEIIKQIRSVAAVLESLYCSVVKLSLQIVQVVQMNFLHMVAGCNLYDSVRSLAN